MMSTSFRFDHQKDYMCSGRRPLPVSTDDGTSRGPGPVSMTDATLSVVIVLYNSADTVVDCLESLPERCYVVVVDNASTDDGVTLAERTRPDAVVLRNEVNRGFGAACNRGAEVVRSGVLAFVNPDLTIKGEALAVLVRRVMAEPQAIVGPALTDAEGVLRANCRKRSRPFHEMLELLPSASKWTPRRLRRDLAFTDEVYARGGEVDYLQGACLVLHREHFAQIGGFDETFFLYSEEEDLCNRVRSKGGQCLFVPEAVARHIAGTSTCKDPTFALAHLYRGRAILYRKQYGDARGRAVAVGIASFALLAQALNPFVRATGRTVRRPRGWLSAVLRGLTQGSLVRLPREESVSES